MQDATTETTTDETTAEGTEERIATNEAIVQANAGAATVDIKAVKEYFHEGSCQPDLSLQDLKALMAKRADGTSDMDDLKKALTPDPATGEPTYTY